MKNIVSQLRLLTFVTAILAMTQLGFAAQGTASYLDFDGTNPGFGTPLDTSETALVWSTASAGTATTTARPTSTQITIGALTTDFAGATFAINLNGGGNLNGVLINSTSVNVSFTGNANTHLNVAQTWTVPAGSTLTVNDTRQSIVGTDGVKGMNWNNQAVLFLGGGTINFPTPFGCNSTASNNMNMPGGIINLLMGVPVQAGAGTYSGGFVLTAGTLNFASAGSSNAFFGFIAGKNFYINGGTIDNTSGSAMTLRLNGGGGYSLGGNFTFTGSSSLDFGSAAVVLTGTRTVTVGANTLTIGPISGTGFGLTKAGAGTLALTGVNTYTGNTTFTNGSTLVLSGAASLPNSPLVVSGSPMDLSGLTSGTMSTPTFSVTNSTLTVGVVSTTATNILTTTLNVGGTPSIINVASLPPVTSYPQTFHIIKATAVNGTLNFALGTIPSASPPFGAYLTNRAASGAVDLVLTNGPAPVKLLTWNGLNAGSPDGTWDVNNTPTWLDAGNAATTFNQLDLVTFNDSATGETNVNLTTTLTPGTLTVSNNILLYTLGGGGKISGTVGLIKQGSGKLILDETGGNDFSGGVTISAGTLQVGNNDGAGNLPPTGNVVDNASLVFVRSDSPIVANIISGTGTVTQNGSGTLNLGGANTFTGAVTVAQGTLQIGNNSALGTTNGITTIADGATLDFLANANNIGQEPVVVSGIGVGGLGALYNSSGSAAFVNPNVARVTLAGDTYFGGSGRWDLRASTTSNPNLASLSTGGVARKLTKVGANQVGLVGVTVDPALGDIEVQAGTFSMEVATTGLGNTASNLIVWPGATFALFAITNLLDKVITLGGDGATFSVSATSGSNNIIGPMALTNDCIFNVNNAAVSLTLNNVITGPGKLTKTGAGLLNLSGASPAYAGGLLVNNGTVAVSGTLNNVLGVTVAAGKFILNGALSGAGLTNNGAASVIAGSGSSAGPVDDFGVINPGDTNVAGTLTVGGLVLESGGSLNYDLATANTVGTGINDLIVVNGDLTVNGNVITIHPLALLPTGGTQYRLFNYTGNLIWNSDLSIQNQGSGTYTFSVDTNTPGQVNLVVVGGGPPVWNGGSLIDANWSDAANWNGVAISASGPLYFAGSTRLNNTNDTTADTTYADLVFNTGAGAFVLNGNPIIPGGNIINSSSNPETVDLGLDFGANFTLDGGAGGLIIGGGLTNTAVAPTKTTLTLAGLGTLTNLVASADPTGTNTISMTSSAANWTLMDNPSSTAITVPWAFDILAGTFNFGTASSAPNFSSTTINGGPQDNRVGNVSGTSGTFNMVNGILTTIARLNTATVANSTGIVNQVGGTLNIGQQFQGANGANANEMSLVNVSGGTMNLGGGTGQLYVASRGNGILTVSGSGAVNCGTLDVSRSIVSGTVGAVNLNGGTITASRVGTATANSVATTTGSTATFDFNGGTLKAGASSATFFQGSTVAPIIPITTIVKSGGAIIDSDTNAISILEPLQHDSSLGATPDGGLRKQGAGTLTLTAASTYTGDTLVNGGTLAVNGSLGATAVTVASGGTLGGSGTVGSNVTVLAGGTVAPGSPSTIATLTVTNGTVSLSGTALMKLNRSNNPSNDVVKCNPGIALGGSLTVTNLGTSPILRSGNAFTLFSTAALTGSITPSVLPLLWPGLTWDTSSLNSAGRIAVAGTVVPPAINSLTTTPTTFGISGSGGLAGATYYVLASTNVAVPFNLWSRVATNTFDGSGNFSYTDTSGLGPQRFYIIQVP